MKAKSPQRPSSTTYNKFKLILSVLSSNHSTLKNIPCSYTSFYFSILPTYLFKLALTPLYKLNIIFFNLFSYSIKFKYNITNYRK